MPRDWNDFDGKTPCPDCHEVICAWCQFSECSPRDILEKTLAEMDEKDPKLWVPDTTFRYTPASINEVTDGYAMFLEVRYREQFKRFKERLINDPDGAKSEAVVFSWLRSAGLQPDLNEDSAKGGPDY